VGADDCYDILYDSNRFSKTRVGQWLIKKGVKPDELPPLIKGIGPTLIPRPEKMYFKFHPPIEAASYLGSDMDAAAWALRADVQRTVETGIADLLKKRSDDQNRFISRRLLKKFAAIFKTN
jgi:hypothetical protein